jgi:hypothetical protein
MPIDAVFYCCLLKVKIRCHLLVFSFEFFVFFFFWGGGGKQGRDVQ